MTAAVHDPEMSVGQSSALAARLTGSFGLYLELGQAAPSGADVSIAQGNFSLVNAANQATLVLLEFTTNPTAPHRVEPGGKLDLACTVAEQVGQPGQLLSKDEQTAICAARAGVQIAGSISDSASGPTPVVSSSFAVTGCP